MGIDVEKKYIVVGAGGHARSVVDCLLSTDKEISRVVDIDYKDRNESILGVPVVGGFQELIEKENSKEVNIAIAVGDNDLRGELFERFKSSGFDMPALIHKTAIVGSCSKVGAGCFLSAGSILNSLVKIGDSSIINTGAVIDHESEIGCNTHVCPNATIAGRVSIGRNCFVGIGSSVIDGIRIGDRVTIGAGSVVLNDVGDDALVVGVPGRVKR